MEGKTRDPKAGVMLRATSDMGAPSVALLYSNRDGVRLFTRDKADGTTKISESLKEQAPGWLRLVRSGDTFTGYRSDDGRHWTPVGQPATVTMDSSITAGLAVTAGNRDGSQQQTATFDSVTVEKAKAAQRQ